VRLGARSAQSLRTLLTLAVACSAILAVSAQASAADPVTGVLDAVGATATQQLDAVARDATAIPPPATPPAVAQVGATAAQDVVAVPQAVERTGDAVRSNTSGLAESSRAGDPGEGNGASDARQPSPRSSLTAIATHTARVVASAPPARGARAAIVTAAHRIAPSRIDRAASSLAYAARRAPAAHVLAGETSRVAGALLGTVADLASSARDTLAAIPVPMPAVVSLLQATLPPNPFTLLPAAAGAGASAAQPSGGATALATNLAAIGSSVQAAPSSVDAFDAQPVQQLATDREASTEARGGIHGPREATPSKTTSLTPSATPANVATPAKAPVAASPAPGQAVPALAPPSGGFTPASSASAGGGVSAATFLALAALLLLAAPRALRRMQRAGTSWRLAQFSLIPARPG
jgi:hypothetical protein